MSKTLKKALPFVLALCLLLGLLPLGGLMASAEIATFEAALNMVGYPVDGKISETFNGDKLLTLHDQNWDSAGITDSIPDGAKLVVKYDVTGVAGTGGLNFYIDALPDAETQSEIWALSRINYLSDATNKMVTLINDGSEWTKEVGVNSGTGCYKSDKHLGLALGTSGYAIIEAPEGYELNTLSGWFFFRWDVVNADVTEDNWKFQIGWVAGDVAIPSCTTTASSTESTESSTSSSEVEKTPLEKFEDSLNMVGMDITFDPLSSMGGDKILCLHSQNWDMAGLTDEIPDGAKLVIKYDATALTADGSVNFYIDALPDAETQQEIWALNRINYLSDATNKMVTLINKDGEWSKEVGVNNGDGCYQSDKHVGFAKGTKGYAIIAAPDGYELNTLSGWFFFRWDVISEALQAQKLGIQLGWVAGDVAIPDFAAEDTTESTESTESSTSESESSSSDAPAGEPGDTIKGTIPAPEVFGDNYVVTDANTQTIEIGKDMCDNPTLNLSSNASAPADAKALVFRFSIPNIELFVPEGGGVAYNEQDKWSHVSYFNFKAFGENFSGNSNAGNLGRMVNYTMCYYKDDLVNVNENGFLKWAGQLPLNCEGYVIVEMEDLQKLAQAKFGKDVTVADIESLTFNQEWYWYAGLYNKQIYISDIGYIKDVEAFTAAFTDSYVPAYEKDTLEPAGDITAKADKVEGTFAELSWNEFEGANRYLVAIYNAEGFYGAEKTRKTAYTLEGLTVGTDYKVQIIAIDADEKILGASNVLEFKTADKNTEPYTQGLLEYDESATAKVEDGVVSWDWIDGVDYYAIHLYEANGDEVTFVERYTVDDKEGTFELTDLEAGKEYVVQLVSYTSDDSIVTVYAPTDAFSVVGGDSTTNGDNDEDTTTSATEDDDVTTPTGGEDIGDDDQTQTGVATTAGVLAIASLLAGGAVVVTRKRR